MKRMTPEQYKGEAHRLIAEATHFLEARLGAWNANKVRREMEKLLKEQRLSPRKGVSV